MVGNHLPDNPCALLGQGGASQRPLSMGILALATLLGWACATDIIQAMPPGLKAAEFLLARYGKATEEGIVLEDVRGSFSYGLQL